MAQNYQIAVFSCQFYTKGPVSYTKPGNDRFASFFHDREAWFPSIHSLVEKTNQLV
jgi:hypothetical protein